MSELKLLVGLGNPGAQYEGTRHNVGFRVLDRLAEVAGVGFQKDGKWEGETARLGSVLMLKPMTFMNESGRSVGSLCRFFRWQPEQVLVVYDDVALPLGTLRFRHKGSHGGHNGVRSLIQHLGSENFPRLKFGIESVSGEALVGHVLGKFKPAERELLENTLARAGDAVQLAMKAGVDEAANRFNQKPGQKQKNTPEQPAAEEAEEPESEGA
ncbi:MAG: aminoacyl-tRNA hydrolase [Verrucomicrobiales bacterium]